MSSELGYSEPSALLCLPIELICMVTDYLDAVSLWKFLLVCTPELKNRILTLGVRHMHFDGPKTPLFPIDFFPRFPNIRSIRISTLESWLDFQHYDEAQTTRELIIPATVEKLIFNCQLSPPTHLPESITHIESTWIKLKTLLTLPDSLTYLSVEADPAHMKDNHLSRLPPALKTLRLHGATELTDNVMQLLPRSLTHLALPRAENIIGLGFQDLPGSLLSLDLMMCDQIDDMFLTFLPIKLTHLNVSLLERISDQNINRLPPDLLHLEMNWNTALTRNGLQNLPRTLTHLSLGHNSKITDDDMKYLPPDLTYLGIYYLTNLSARGIQYIPRSIKTLKVFGLKKSVHQTFLHLPPNLTVLYYPLNNPQVDIDTLKQIFKDLKVIIDTNNPMVIDDSR